MDVDLDATSSILLERLKDFTYYFLKRLEQKFKDYLHIIEEESKGAASKATLAGAILSSASSLIPTLGKGISSAIAQGDTFLSNRNDKANALRLSELVNLHAKGTPESRRMYVNAAYEIFCCYEKQFMQVTCKGGTTRAIEKLAHDAVQRFIHATLTANETELMDVRIVIERIVENRGNILQDLGLIKLGRTVKSKSSAKKTWNSGDIYSKVGVYHAGTFYANELCDIDTYGYRLKFSFETDAILKENYRITDENEDDVRVDDYVLSLNDFDAHYKSIMRYYNCRTDMAMVDRQEKHDELVKEINDAEANAHDDRNVKHTKAIQHREELHADLKADHVKQEALGAEILTRLNTVTSQYEKELVQVREMQNGTIVINRKHIDDMIHKIDLREFKRLKIKLEKIKL